MPRLPKYNSSHLFHKLAKEVKVEFERQGRTESWNEIQKWTAQNVFPQFKGTSYRAIPIVKIQEQIFVRTAPKTKIKCGNVFEVSPSSYELIDWFDIYNKIAELPSNVQARVNAGDEFGVTQIEHAQFFEYEGKISEIIDAIRETTENKSGVYFDGVIKVRPDRKDDGENCSYFIDYVLSDAAGAIDSVEGISRPPDVQVEDDRKRLGREKEAQRKLRLSKSEKVKKAKTRKRPKDVKKPAVEKAAEAQRDRAAEIRELRKLYDDGILTKDELKNMISIVISKEKGGEI